jgi:transcriptional regulator with XRE-family HTH domain
MSVRTQREARNLLQPALAERAGLSVAYVAAAERGERVIRIDQMEQLAEFSLPKDASMRVLSQSGHEPTMR